MMNRGYQHNLKDKLQSEINELTETEVRAPETKPSKEGKEMLPFATQYKPLVSTVQ